MAVNYNDSRFQEVEKEKNQAIQETTSQYDQMINNTDSMYQQQIEASQNWADKQTELQQAQTDFALDKIEQAKDKAQKDYTKEQKAAYADYQKATDQYGVNAEKMATQGLQRSGYSESTMTNMYNTYQNRYMVARESYNQAVLNYDNSIKEAQLANNTALAQIAYEALQKQLELSLQGFQYKNQLVLQKLQAVDQQKDRYYNRYKDVLNQINTENAFQEQVRQFNEQMAYNRSKSGSSEDKIRLDEDLIDDEKTPTAKLSSAAKEVQTAAKKILNTSTGMINRSKEFATDYLAVAFEKGSITQSELKTIAKNLGIE